jgi:Ca2+-binding RTX toxin-like protein
VIVAAVVALWLVASSPALAQLSFASNDNPLFGAEPEAVVSSDFNSDSLLDLATADEGFFTFHEGVEVLLNGGGGSFGSTQTLYAADDAPVSLDIGELNGDGHIDLAVANTNSQDVSVLLGAGDGSFGGPQNPTNYMLGGNVCAVPPPSPSSVVVGFFDADRHPDLAVADGTCNAVWVLLNNGDGTFGTPNGFPTDVGPLQVATGEFNDDGNLDLVTANGIDASGASVLLGRGDGSFTSAPEASTAGDTQLGVAVGDFNGDTKADLAFADDPSGPNGEIAIVLGEGDGTFEEKAFYAVGSATTSVAVGDFNADSVLDLATTDNFGDGSESGVLCNQASGDVWVLPGMGDGTFGNPQNFPVPDASAVTVANFDSNPLPDMAVASNELSISCVTVLLNTTPRPSPGPEVSVAAGGSCAPDGRKGTLQLALADGGDRAGGLSLSFTSDNPAVVPTDAVTVGGSGISRTLTVRPVAGRSGTTVVTVNQLSHGQLTGSVPVTVRVGANGTDHLTAGRRRADIMFGRNGADTLTGGAGNDLLCAGNGTDTLSGGDGEDALTGGDGEDVLTGGDGEDVLRGKGGDDELGGGAGNDVHTGGRGDDVLRGKGGDDKLRGGDGDDVHRGGGGADDCRGGRGSDRRNHC